MATATEVSVIPRTVAHLLTELGDVPPERVRLVPTPGSATEADLLRPAAKLCELVDGVLVEKAMGIRESRLAGYLLTLINVFAVPRRLGMTMGADGMVRLWPGLVRVPDVAFVCWDRSAGKPTPEASFLEGGPDLAVEVLSPSNTPAEMTRKRTDYFEAGVRLVWEFDPRAQTVAVYRRADAPDAVLTTNDQLEGAEVLPGFVVSLEEFFKEMEQWG